MAEKNQKITRNVPDAVRLQEGLFSAAVVDKTLSHSDKIKSKPLLPDSGPSSSVPSERKPISIQQVEEDMGQPVQLSDPQAAVDSSACSGGHKGIFESLRENVVKTAETLTGGTPDGFFDSLTGQHIGENKLLYR